MYKLPYNTGHNVLWRNRQHLKLPSRCEPVNEERTVKPVLHGASEWCQLKEWGLVQIVKNMENNQDKIIFTESEGLLSQITLYTRAAEKEMEK